MNLWKNDVIKNGVIFREVTQCSMTMIFLWVTVVTPTDRPKSVRNRCVIEVFGGFFVLSRCFLDFSVSVGVFVMGPSQISF